MVCFEIRHYGAEDYPLVKQWWEGHGWTAVEEKFLPRPGIVCLVDGVPAGAVWLYMSNSNGVAMMEWLVVRPDLPARQALEVIRHLLAGVEIECREADYGVIFTTARQAGLARILEKAGFVETDREMIHLIKAIGIS